jgi:hypothetical protein
MKHIKQVTQKTYNTKTGHIAQKNLYYIFNGSKLKCGDDLGLLI